MRNLQLIVVQSRLPQQRVSERAQIRNSVAKKIVLRSQTGQCAPVESDHSGSNTIRSLCRNSGSPIVLIDSRHPAGQFIAGSRAMDAGKPTTGSQKRAAGPSTSKLLQKRRKQSDGAGSIGEVEGYSVDIEDCACFTAQETEQVRSCPFLRCCNFWHADTSRAAHCISGALLKA